MTRTAGELLAEERRGADSNDGRRIRGQQSRAAVLERSVQLASRYGLEGLTVGMLSADLGLHKSSVHSLFGSKVELQLATLTRARAILIEQVIEPSVTSAPGLARLRAIGDSWCDYLSTDVFAGGCFLCAASAEMDGRPGPLRDAVERVMREWMAVLGSNIERAKAEGEFHPDVDPDALSFRLNALGMAANWQRQLLGDEAGIDHARAAWRAELERAVVGAD